MIYGHPLTIRVLKTSSRVNARMPTPYVDGIVIDILTVGASGCRTFFGNNQWRSQPFMSQKGSARENNFLEYFISGLHAKYVLPFRIGFDPEDKMKGERTKYYLLHASNNSRAVLLMKEVMWPLGDEDGTFDFSVESQGVLISRTPQLDELRGILLRHLREEKLRSILFARRHGSFRSSKSTIAKLSRSCARTAS